MLLPVVLFASFALVQQVPAEPAPPAPQAQAPAAAPTPAQALSTVDVRSPQAEIARVCRTEPVTGSRFGRRVCRSPIETNEERIDSREMLRQMQGARVPAVG